jgi:hypothetical protein
MSFSINDLTFAVFLNKSVSKQAHAEAEASEQEQEDKYNSAPACPGNCPMPALPVKLRATVTCNPED